MRVLKHRYSFFIIIAFCLCLPYCDQPALVSELRPESLGLSTERLDRIGEAIQKNIDAERIAGAVALVARHGKAAYFKPFGMMDKDAQRPMQKDTIFRICSMTKPITSVAVMMLYEEGHFMLSDPVSDFIPELADMQVLDPPFPDCGNSLPAKRMKAKRPITIRHLLTHTSGLTYSWDPILGKEYNEKAVGSGLAQQEGTIGEAVKRLSTIPLLFHPGENYMYSAADDVLGYLVEVVSGMTLDEFFEERIFKSLGMADSHFYLPESKVPRLAKAYTYFDDKGLQLCPEEPLTVGPIRYSAGYPYKGPKTYFAGGAGLCSTTEDYLKFCQMLLNNGVLNDVRLLSRKSVELIPQNHVGDLLKTSGYGLGFGTNSEPSHLRELGSVGAYYWGGFFYTSFIIDPKEDMIAIFMSQLYPTGGLNLRSKALNLAYQAIID